LRDLRLGDLDRDFLLLFDGLFLLLFDDVLDHLNVLDLLLARFFDGFVPGALRREEGAGLSPGVRGIRHRARRGLRRRRWSVEDVAVSLLLGGARQP
jgi:hypothetical protein